MEKELISETFDVPLVSSSVVDSAGSTAPTASGGGAGVLHHHEAVVPLALPAGLGGPSALPLQLCHSGGGSIPENCDSCYESDETQSVGNHSNATPSLSAGSDTLKAEHCDTINDVPTTTTTTTHQLQQLHMHQQQLPAEHPHSINNKHPLHKHHPHLQHADSVKRQFEAAQCMAISVNNNNNDNDVVAVVATDNMDAKQQQQLRQQLQRIVVTASSSCNSCTSAATDCNSSSSSYKRTDGNVGSCKANDTIAMGTTRNDNDNMLHMHNTVQHAQGNAASSSGVLPSFEMSSQRHPYDSETTDVVVEAADSDCSEDEDVTLWAGYSAKLDFALKLGYEERALQTILREEGPHVTKNVLLERLIACHGENTSSGEDCDSAERRVDIGDNNNYCDQQEYCEGDDKRDLPANDDMLRAIREDPESNLRFIVIDGSNVAMSHGQKQVFSCMGIKLAVDYFTQRGHTNIVVFVPSWRKETPKADTPITDQDILLDLEREKRLVFTPSRRVNGRRVVCYDDLYILNLAVMKDAVVVSNDVYRDLIRNDKYKHVIENRLLMFSFANDCFMPPDDPLGRHGPSLDNFLCKHPVAPEPAPKICPYLKKCTYGHKCKFLHPERKNQPLQSVTDKLAEQTKAKRKEALERVTMPAVSREASPVPPSKTKLHKTSSSEFISSHKKALSRTSSLNKVPVQKKQLTRTHSLVPESSPALVTKEKLSPKKSVPVGPTPSAAEIFGQAARATSPEQQRPAVTIANKPKCEVTVSPPRYTSPLSPIVSDEREAFAELEHLTLESDKSPGPGDRLKTPTHDPLRATTSAPDQNENARSAGFTCKELLSGHVAFAMALSEETKSASKSSPQLYHSEHTAEHMRHSGQPLVLQPPPLQRPQTQNIQPSQQQQAKPKEKMALTRQLSLTGSDDPRVIQQQQRLGIQQPQQPRAIFHDAQRPKTSVHHALSHPIGGIHEEQNYLGMEDGATAPVEATQMEQFSKMKLGPMTSAPVTMQSDYHRDRSASPNVMGNEYYMPDPNAGVAHAAQTWNSQQNVQLEHPQSATTTSASTVPTFRFHSSSNPQWMMSMSPRHRRHQAVGGHVYPAARKGINDANFYRTQPPPLMNPQPGHMVGLMAMPPTTVTGSHPQLQDQPPLIPAADVPFDNLTSRTGYRSMTNLPVDSLGGATVEAPYRPHYGSQGHLSNTAGATLAPAPAPQGPAAAIPGGPGAPPSGPALLAGPTDIDPRSSNVSSDRNELYNNLCKFFPSNKVLQIMSRYPLESDSHVLLKYLLDEKIT